MECREAFYARFFPPFKRQWQQNCGGTTDSFVLHRTLSSLWHNTHLDTHTRTVPHMRSVVLKKSMSNRRNAPGTGLSLFLSLTRRTFDESRLSPAARRPRKRRRMRRTRREYHRTGKGDPRDKEKTFTK